MRAWVIIVMSCTLVSCGYRWGNLESVADSPTLTIPYVRGDIEGQLTEELVRRISASGCFECVHEGGELHLDVIIVGNETERVGFRYLREHKSGKRQNNLVGVENRHVITAQVALTRLATQEIVFGPVLVKADAEYDYVDPSSIQDLAFINPEGAPQTSIQFSLGQLDSVEGAQDAARTPLYRHLAQKILDTIISKKW